MRIIRRAGIALCASLLLPVLAGCGGDGSPRDGRSSPQPATVTAATLRRDEPIPLPAAGDVVLVIDGAGNPNRGDDLVLSLEQIEAMGTVGLEVDDTVATGRRSEFTGPLLRTLLEYADVQGKAIHAAALNDYRIDIPMTDATELPVIVATRQDGRRMSIAHYGPLRVIYPQRGYALASAEVNARLIWQLDQLSVS
jgi:hypothetical protein